MTAASANIYVQVMNVGSAPDPVNATWSTIDTTSRCRPDPMQGNMDDIKIMQVESTGSNGAAWVLNGADKRTVFKPYNYVPPHVSMVDYDAKFKPLKGKSRVAAIAAAGLLYGRQYANGNTLLYFCSDVGMHTIISVPRDTGAESLVTYIAYTKLAQKFALQCIQARNPATQIKRTFDYVNVGMDGLSPVGTKWLGTNDEPDVIARAANQQRASEIELVRWKDSKETEMLFRSKNIDSRKLIGGGYMRADVAYRLMTEIGVSRIDDISKYFYGRAQYEAYLEAEALHDKAGRDFLAAFDAAALAAPSDCVRSYLYTVIGNQGKLVLAGVGVTTFVVWRAAVMLRDRHPDRYDIRWDSACDFLYWALCQVCHATGVHILLEQALLLAGVGPQRSMQAILVPGLIYAVPWICRRGVPNNSAWLAIIVAAIALADYHVASRFGSGVPDSMCLYWIPAKILGSVFYPLWVADGLVRPT